jgi:tetratricopeptide (TPR) repeat protein
VQAYQDYVRGRYFWNQRNEAGLRKSLDHFAKAIELDPGYGQAYAGLADAYILIAYYGVDSTAADDAIRKGRAAATKALTIDEGLAEAHASMGLIKARYDHDEAGADREFRRALELNPSYATAHHWYSEFLLMIGRDEQALAEIVKAQELDPLSPVINTTVGERLFYMRRYDDAIAQLRRTLETAPDFDAAHFVLGLCLEQKGMLQESIIELQKVRGTSAMNRGAVASMAHAYAAAGQEQKARKVLRDLLAEKESAPFLIAIVYEGLGESCASWNG